MEEYYVHETNLPGITVTRPILTEEEYTRRHREIERYAANLLRRQEKIRREAAEKEAMA